MSWLDSVFSLPPYLSKLFGIPDNCDRFVNALDCIIFLPWLNLYMYQVNSIQDGLPIHTLFFFFWADNIHDYDIVLITIFRRLIRQLLLSGVIEGREFEEASSLLL